MTVFNYDLIIVVIHIQLLREHFLFAQRIVRGNIQKAKLEKKTRWKSYAYTEKKHECEKEEMTTFLPQCVSVCQYIA